MHLNFDISQHPEFVLVMLAVLFFTATFIFVLKRLDEIEHKLDRLLIELGVEKLK